MKCMRTHKSTLAAEKGKNGHERKNEEEASSKDPVILPGCDVGWLVVDMRGQDLQELKCVDPFLCLNPGLPLGQVSNLEPRVCIPCIAMRNLLRQNSNHDSRHPDAPKVKPNGSHSDIPRRSSKLASMEKFPTIFLSKRLEDRRRTK